MSVVRAPPAAHPPDLFNLLNFPSRSNGLSEYKSRLRISTADAPSQQQQQPQSPRSRSPPRKTARLEGDSDYASSITRSSDTGKGKQRADAPKAIGDGVKAFTISNPPGMFGAAETRQVELDALPDNTRSDDYFNSLLRTIQNGIHGVLSPPQRSLGAGTRSRPFVYEVVFNATRTVVMIASKGQWVYDKLQFELRGATATINKTLISHNDPKSAEWLEELVNATVWFDKCLRLLETLLTYLDLVFVSNKADALHVR